MKNGLNIWTLCMSIYNWNQNNIIPGSLVEVIWVCKVYDSCEQTLDSFNKFYIFNHGWLNESSIKMTPTNQHISKRETIFMWQIVLQSPFQGISSPSYASERTLNSSHGENARLSKIANRSTSNFFLLTFVQLWWFSIVMDTVYVNF